MKTTILFNFRFDATLQFKYNVKNDLEHIVIYFQPFSIITTT